MSENINILIAPDKFKGSLSAMEVCRAIGEGLEQSGKKCTVHFHPIADGGDGSLEIIEKHLNLEKHLIAVNDLLGRTILSYYFTASNIAFVELASASGLVLLDASERNPMKTSTFGTGEMVADASQSVQSVQSAHFAHSVRWRRDKSRLYD